MQRDGIYGLMERLLAKDMHWGMGAVMFEQVHSDEHLWHATLETSDGEVHRQPYLDYSFEGVHEIADDLATKVWGPASDATLAPDRDPAGDPRCVRLSWSGSIERAPGYSAFSFWVNYWWKDELDASNFGNWMSLRAELAGGDRFAPWTGNAEGDEAFEDDPSSNATFAVFEDWWGEKRDVFAWHRLVNIMNSAPSMPAATALELFLDPEFPDDLIADYGRAGVETTEAGREFHREGVALEFIAAMNGR
jgi:hypothetical protein